MTVFVAGVNGQIGSLLAARAQDAGLDVVGGSAHPEQAGERSYQVLAVDLGRPETVRSALRGATAAFLYPAATAVESLVAELVRADLQHVVVMTSSAVVLPGAERLAGHFHVVEDAVRAADLPWTILRPDAFASNSKAWADQVRTLGQVALPYPDAHVVPVHESDIVDAALAALTDDRHREKAYLLTGPESMTQRQQVGVIAQVLAREVGVVELNREQWRGAVQDVMPSFVAEALLDVWAGTVGTPQPTDHTVEQVTGQQARTFAQWVSEHVDVFRR